jgi:hypothetical protein
MLALVGAVIAPATQAAAQLFAGVGAEIDDESGYLLSATIGGGLGNPTSWDVGLSRADTSSARTDIDLTALDGSVRHDFGTVGLRFGLGSWDDSRFVTTDEVTAAIDFHGDVWSFAIEAELQTSDFDVFEVDRTITLRDGTMVTVTARADCKLDDTGLGARLRMSDQPWSFDVALMSYDYDRATCSFDLPVLDRLRSTTRDEFVQLADRTTALLSLGAGLRILTGHALVDSRQSASLSYEGSTRIYSAYYDHVEEVFFGLETDTLSGGVTFILPTGNEIEVYAGAATSDGIDDVGFLGFQMLFAL